jgi:hypothetical protein
LAILQQPHTAENRRLILRHADLGHQLARQIRWYVRVRGLVWG